MEVRITPLLPYQRAAILNPFQHFAFYAGIGCVRASTLIETQMGQVRIDELKAGDLVAALTDEGVKFVACERPYKKGRTRLFRVVHEAGEFVAHARHLLLCSDGNYRPLESLCVGDVVCSFYQNQLHSNSVFGQKSFFLNARHYKKIASNSAHDYQALNRSYDQQPHALSEVCSTSFPSVSDEQAYIQHDVTLDVQIAELINNHRDRFDVHPSILGSLDRKMPHSFFLEDFLSALPIEQTLQNIQPFYLFQKTSDCRRIAVESLSDHEFFLGPSKCSLFNSVILEIEPLSIEEDFWDMHIPGPENYLAEGFVHHNSGKSFTGSHFIIKHLLEHPEKTGLIGANDYVQLSTATLRELFIWLDKYGFEYVIDKQPPASWGQGREFKNYLNVMHVKNPWNDKVSVIFTRVMSEPNSMRGTQFSYYWLDETRDTAQEAHDIILSRLRESDYIKGLITTTPNGQGWDYIRFVKNADRKIYGSMHVKTIESVKAGILTQNFYDTLVKSYSPMMVLQELEAEHVNIYGGRAYYAASEKNKMATSPWGDYRPDPDQPLIVGCDFNFAPAPCAWIIGQRGPNEWHNHIHWFREISSVQTSTESMTLMLINQFPGFFYRIFGDASGNRGTTSNAGRTDYNRIANILSENGCQFSIDVEQSNPLVKDRIENMNSLFQNAMGEVRQTYNPSGCPLFDDDLRIVGWKKRVNMTGQGRLDDCGDTQRTHASDAAGYACWKIFPPGRRATIVESNVSIHKQDIMDEVESNTRYQ